MNNFIEQNVSLEKCPALVLNADYRPLSYYPLSLWSWQDTVKSVFLDRVIIVSNYDRVIRSPSFDMQLPSVIALKDYIIPQTRPSFTRFNVFLRDKFSCQYCGSGWAWGHSRRHRNGAPCWPRHANSSCARGGS